MAENRNKGGGNELVVSQRALTPAQYQALADVPPELEWLANITNPKTREAYRIDVQEFSTFAGLRGPAEFRTVTRAHVIAWRKHLETRGLADSTIRRKLSALFDYLCERNAVPGNPVDGVKRPSLLSSAGAISIIMNCRICASARTRGSVAALPTARTAGAPD